MPLFRSMTSDEQTELEELLPSLAEDAEDADMKAKIHATRLGGTAFENAPMAEARLAVAAAYATLAGVKREYRAQVARALGHVR